MNGRVDGERRPARPARERPQHDNRRKKDRSLIMPRQHFIRILTLWVVLAPPLAAGCGGTADHTVGSDEGNDAAPTGNSSSTGSSSSGSSSSSNDGSAGEATDSAATGDDSSTSSGDGSACSP